MVSSGYFVTILNGYKETMMDKYVPVMDIQLMVTEMSTFRY